MKRNLAIGAVVALVVSLVVINLAMVEDPEPEFEPSTDPSSERGRSDVLRERASVEPSEPDPGEVGPDPEPTATEQEAQAEAADEVDGCDHPYLPARAGQWRHYRWTLSTEEHEAETRIRAVSTRPLDNGEREVIWRIRATSRQAEEPLAEMTLRTRCAPGDEGEDPWFGILERAIGHRLTRRTPRWRWPVELRPGVAFRGTATLDPSAADAVPPEGVEGEHMLTVTRHHIVGEQVEVEVPAGRFRAWRVAYEERQAYGPHGETGTGTLWVAPEVGLVKSRAENSRGVVQTIELVRMGGDEQ